MNKEILKEDLKDLQFLIDKYRKEKNYEKMEKCKEELKRIEKELNGGN
jgi:hypothetical protein